MWRSSPSFHGSFTFLRYFLFFYLVKGFAEFLWKCKSFISWVSLIPVSMGSSKGSKLHFPLQNSLDSPHYPDLSRDPLLDDNYLAGMCCHSWFPWTLHWILFRNGNHHGDFPLALRHFTFQLSQQLWKQQFPSGIPQVFGKNIPFLGKLWTPLDLLQDLHYGNDALMCPF